MDPLTGVFPVVPTPFKGNGDVDVPGMERLVDYAISAGASALVFPGVASEDVHLNADERAACLAAVSAAAAGRVPVIVGVNSADPDEMVKLAERAAGLGANGIMAMAVPAMGEDRIVSFERIATATGGLPIILQNLGKPRGADLSAEEMLELAAAIPAIRYVKEEGIPSGPRVSRLVAGGGTYLDGVIGGGGARYLFEELERGVVGTMPALELIEIHVAIVSAHLAGRREEALALYERTLPLLLIQQPYRMRMTKLILAHRGLIAADTVREPLPEMDAMLKNLVLEFYSRLTAAIEFANG